MVQNMIAGNALDIREAKFKLFGQVWGVFDWTVTVIILASVFFSLAFTFLFCFCCASTAESEEEELQAEIDRLRKEADLAALLKAREETMKSFSKELFKAQDELKDNEIRERKREVVMANVDINAIMNDGDEESKKAAEPEKQDPA